jgi:hypothetical protein
MPNKRGVPSFLVTQRQKLSNQKVQKEKKRKERNAAKYEAEKAAREASGSRGYGYSMYQTTGSRARTFREFVEIAETITEAKRLKFVKMYHGTSASSADKIKKSGFNTSDVYTSTDRETATSFGQRKGEKTKTVAFRVPKKDINTPGKIMKTDGQRGVDKWGREHYSTVMNPDYAKKHVIDCPQIVDSKEELKHNQRKNQMSQKQKRQDHQKKF